MLGISVEKQDGEYRRNHDSEQLQPKKSGPELGFWPAGDADLRVPCAVCAVYRRAWQARGGRNARKISEPRVLAASKSVLSSHPADAEAQNARGPVSVETGPFTVLSDCAGQLV